MATAKQLSFKVEIKRGHAYFTPVNKRAKRVAKAHNLRTLVTKADLKTFKSEGSYKFGVYTEQENGKLAFASIKV